MIRVCIVSIQNVERSLLLLVVSASDILRTIKFFSVLFGVFVHTAGRHKQTLAGVSPTVRCIVVRNCFCHFVVRTSSNRSIASGGWPTVSYTQRRVVSGWLPVTFFALGTSSNLR